MTTRSAIHAIHTLLVGVSLICLTCWLIGLAWPNGPFQAPWRALYLLYTSLILIAIMRRSKVQLYLLTGSLFCTSILRAPDLHHGIFSAVGLAQFGFVAVYGYCVLFSDTYLVRSLEDEPGKLKPIPYDEPDEFELDSGQRSADY